MSTATRRVPRLHGPLGRPRNLPDVLARTLVLTRAHGAAFDDATPTEVVRALFAGWVLVGERRGIPDQARHVFLLRHGSDWFGFGLFAESTKPVPPTDPHPSAMVDYLALMRTHRDQAPWHAIDGAARLERFRVALTSAVLDRPIAANSAVQFLEVAAERAKRKVDSKRANHVDYMCDILLNEAEAIDPDGTLAVARTLAGLGRYDHLAPIAQEG